MKWDPMNADSLQNRPLCLALWIIITGDNNNNDNYHLKGVMWLRCMKLSTATGFVTPLLRILMITLEKIWHSQHRKLLAFEFIMSCVNSKIFISLNDHMYIYSLESLVGGGVCATSHFSGTQVCALHEFSNSFPLPLLVSVYTCLLLISPSVSLSITGNNANLTVSTNSWRPL
jgi:hypothetical protein